MVPTIKYNHIKNRSTQCLDCFDGISFSVGNDTFASDK